MIFVDGCVLESVVGPAGAARDDAQVYFLRALDLGIPLVTSASALLQATTEIKGSGTPWRTEALLELIRGRLVDVWPLEAEDIYHAHRLQRDFFNLEWHALVKLAACRRRGVGGIQTHDGVLRVASRLGGRGWRRTGRDTARAFQREWEEKRRRERGEPPSWPG